MIFNDNIVRERSVAFVSKDDGVYCFKCGCVHEPSKKCFECGGGIGLFVW